MNVRRDRCPHNRSAHTHNPAAILPLCAFALVLLLAPIASGQTLAGVVMLPDTLGPLNGPYCLAWDDNPAHPRLYVGGVGGFYPGQPPEDSGGVIVAEAITCKRLARIPTGPVKALCFVAPHNKLYVAKLNTDSVEVVDCATNQVISAVPVAASVPVMEYNSQNHRLYCGGSTTSVIDCSADTLLHTIPVSASVFALDSIHNELYVGRNGPLSVIDCTQDSVIATIPEISLDSALCFNPTAGKMYAASGDTLYAIRTDGDSVVARLAFSGLAPLLACDLERNRVYCVYTNHWASVDCAGDSVITVALVGLTASFEACDVARDRLYLTYPTYEPAADVYDATGGQYLTSVPLDGLPSGAGWSQGLDRLYCLPAFQTTPPSQSCLLTTMSGASDSLTGIVPLTMWAGSLSVDSVNNRLYFMYPGTTIGCIGTADCSQNIAVSYTYAGEHPGPICYNPNNNRLYWSTFIPNVDDGTVTVFDCGAGTVLKQIRVIGGVDATQMHLGLNKLYCEGKDEQDHDVISVIDCNGDSIMKRLALPDGYLMRKLALVPEDNRLWYVGAFGRLVIDCLRDSIVANVYDTLGSLDDVVCCPGDRKMFAGWFGSPLWIIDMDNPAHVDTLPKVGDVGMRFCDVPNAHKVYWWANDDNDLNATVRVIDSRTNVITATFRVEHHVSGMCLDHTGDYMYCACSVDSLVLVMDTRVDSLVATVRLPTWPSIREPLNANRQTNRIYVAQHGSAYGNGIPVIRDSMSIGFEEIKAATPIPRIGPTVFHQGVPLPSETTANLYDASGRRVAALQLGLNDIGQLAPGVYFVREQPQAASLKPQAVRKVVVLRQ